MIDTDLFGNEIEKNIILREKFMEYPFTVLDAKTGYWQSRKKQWRGLGIMSELGREEKLTFNKTAQPPAFYTAKSELRKKLQREPTSEETFEYYESLGLSLIATTSIFDPALCELMYYWFCPDGGSILDPFAGGSVRGIVANYLGYKYTGIELRPEQVESNRAQGLAIIPENQPVWYVGDSDKILGGIIEEFDFVFSCPPYFDLEVYSDLPDDLSNMNYENFLNKYTSIIRKTIARAKKDAFICFVVGEVRGKDGYYLDFVGDTVKAFMANGAGLYNDVILLNSFSSAVIRTKQFDSNKKLVKVHQNVLIFKKK